MDIYNLYCDGACTKNPGGEASFGFSLVRNGGEIDYGFGIIGRGTGMSEFVAENYAIDYGVQSFFRHTPGECELNIFSDSKYAVSLFHKGLINPYLSRNINELKRYKVQITMNWIPREENTRADLLSKRLFQKF